jgi:hypothetical protein
VQPPPDAMMKQAHGINRFARVFALPAKSATVLTIR